MPLYALDQYEAYGVRDHLFDDHNYSQPWHSAPEATLRMPARFLLRDDSAICARSVQEEESRSEETDDEIDVGVDDSFAQPKTVRWTPSVHPKSFQESLNDSWSNAAVVCSVRPDDPDEVDWEENLNKLGWSTEQHKLFDQLMATITEALLGSRCVPASEKGKSTSRLHIDEAAKRLRGIFATIEWNTPLVQWLHTVMMENAGYSALAIYLEIIQALRAMVPVLMERIVQVGIMKRAIPPEVLNFVMRKPAEPEVAAVTPINKQRNITLLVLEAFPQQAAIAGGQSACQKRQGFWNDSLQRFGRVVLVTPSLGTAGLWTVKHYVESMENALQTKIAETRQQLNMSYQSQKLASRVNTDKNAAAVEESEDAALMTNPIVLVGWNSGAAVCAQMARKMADQGIAAVVSLGFPTATLVGKRCQADDALLDLDCNTMFVVGENAANCRLEDLETLREKMKGPSSLVVIGGADEHLLVSKETKMREKMSQTAVDTMILNEISQYLEATMERYQKPVLGSLIVPQEEAVTKTVDTSGLKSVAGSASFGPHRTGHVSYDQPFSVNRFGSARPGVSATPAPGSKHEATGTSVAGPSSAASVVPGPSSSVPGLTTGNPFTDQERLDSAIASILGDSGKDDTDIFLGGFDDTTPLLDINVGDAAAAVASIAEITGSGLGAPSALDALLTPSTSTSPSSLPPVSFPDPFMVPLSPPTSLAISGPLSNALDSFSLMTSTGGLTATPTPAAPKEAVSRKRQRQSLGLEQYPPSKSARKEDQVVATPSTSNSLTDLTLGLTDTTPNRSVFVGSPELALSQFAAPTARVDTSGSSGNRSALPKKALVNAQRFRFGVSPGGMLQTAKPSTESLQSSSFLNTSVASSVATSSSIATSAAQFSGLVGSTLLTNTLLNVGPSPTTTRPAPSVGGMKTVSLSLGSKMPAPPSIHVTSAPSIPISMTSTGASGLTTSTGAVLAAKPIMTIPAASMGSKPIQLAGLGSNFKVVSVAPGGLGLTRTATFGGQKIFYVNSGTDLQKTLKLLQQGSTAATVPLRTVSTSLGTLPVSLNQTVRVGGSNAVQATMAGGEMTFTIPVSSVAGASGVGNVVNVTPFTPGAT